MGSSDTSQPARVAIVGCSGAGKSTLARALSERLQLPHLELDGLYHQAGWTPARPADFIAAAREHTPPEGAWVACGNYESSAGADVRKRANHIVFLDLPKKIVMGQVTRRSLQRVGRGVVLWNGNRERWYNLLHPDPRKNIVLWAFFAWKRYRRDFRNAMQDGRWAHARVWHLQSNAEVKAWLDRWIRSFGTG